MLLRQRFSFLLAAPKTNIWPVISFQLTEEFVKEIILISILRKCCGRVLSSVVCHSSSFLYWLSDSAVWWWFWLSWAVMFLLTVCVSHRWTESSLDSVLLIESCPVGSCSFSIFCPWIGAARLWCIFNILYIFKIDKCHMGLFYGPVWKNMTFLQIATVSCIFSNKTNFWQLPLGIQFNSRQ